MAIKKVAVVGAGMMGQGISEAIATAGTTVILVDLSQDKIEEAMKKIGENLDAAIERWALTKSDKKAILSRIQGVIDIQSLSGQNIDIVIEAVKGTLKSKQELFKQLDIILPHETVLVTNTSTLSVSEIGSVMKNPQRFIGIHFIIPVPKVPLVEIVRGLKTSNETYSRAREFAELLGKTSVEVYEYPGYITTRILCSMLNESMEILLEGVASAEDIDTAMKLAYGLNMGPLCLADTIGLDVLMIWMTNLKEELGEKYNPSPILRKMVRAGHLGKKTGQGFFKYDEHGNKID